MDEDQKYLPKLEDSYEVGEKMKRSSSSSVSSEHDADHHDHEMMKEGEIFDEDTAVERSHKCNICEKTFQNSQSLGGHRRSHIHQALKKKSMTHISNLSKQGTIRVNFNDNDDDVGDFDDEKSISDVCNEKKNSDLPTSPLPKWKYKNKRGKRGGEMYMAATTLMTMPKDKNCFPEVLLPFKKRKLPIGESSKRKEVQPLNKIRVVYNSLMMLGKNNDVGDGSGGRGSSGLSESKVDESKVQKKKSNKKPEGSTSTYDPDIGGYKCSLCGKCFSCFQGLGGHKSSHKKYDTLTFLHESNNSDVVSATVATDVQGNNSSSINVVADVQENISSSTSEDVPKVEEVKAVIKEPMEKYFGQKKVDFDLNEQYL